MPGSDFSESCIIGFGVGVVDLWHAFERLWDVSKQLHVGREAAIEAWAEARCDELESGRFETVLAALRSAADSDKAQECVGYMERNRDRMRYAEFRAAGLCVGSGVVESACKSIVGMRLKRSGMHWTVDGANEILARRCCTQSDRYEDFWAHRSAET